MKLNNIFYEIKIAFVDPRDILVIFVGDTAKAIIDILLHSHETSFAPGHLWLPLHQLPQK